MDWRSSSSGRREGGREREKEGRKEGGWEGVACHQPQCDSDTSWSGDPSDRKDQTHSFHSSRKRQKHPKNARVEHPLCKRGAPSSNPTPPKKLKQEKRQQTLRLSDSVKLLWETGVMIPGEVTCPRSPSRGVQVRTQLSDPRARSPRQTLSLRAPRSWFSARPANHPADRVLNIFF
jgi:hypothetical protein